MPEVPADTAKRYLGDGCYVAFDGYAVVLTTEDGVSVTNRIVIEPAVYQALHAYVRQLPSNYVWVMEAE